MKNRKAIFGRRILIAACALTACGFATTAHAKVTVADCVSAMNKGVAVRDLALKTPSLYPTAADAQAAGNAAFTRQIMAEDVPDRWARAGKHYTGDGRDPDDFNYALELCRKLRAPHVANAAGLFAKVIVKGVRGPKTGK